jgi:hypothetical protein
MNYFTCPTVHGRNTHDNFFQGSAVRHYEMKTEPTLVKIIDDVLWCVIKPKGGKRVELIFSFAFLPPVFIVIGTH